MIIYCPECENAPHTQNALKQLVDLFEQTGDNHSAQQFRELLDSTNKTIN